MTGSKFLRIDATGYHRGRRYGARKVVGEIIGLSILNPQIMLVDQFVGDGCIIYSKLINTSVIFNITDRVVQVKVGVSGIWKSSGSDGLRKSLR